MNTAATKTTLLKRLEGLHHIPTIPAVLAPLLRYLQQPLEQLDVQKVTEMIAQDKSLAAQCLQMANSPLFGRWQKIDSLRAAIVGLGFQRVSDIAMSCGVLNMMPRNSGIDPVAFWEHSLGCALVCPPFCPQDFLSRSRQGVPRRPAPRSRNHRQPLGFAERVYWQPSNSPARKEFLFTKQSRRFWDSLTAKAAACLADRWELAPDLKEVVSLHHTPQEARDHAALVAIVELSDLLCRMSGLNYGYVEYRQVNLLEQSGFAVLSRQCQGMKDLDWARLTFELDSYLDDVHSLVRTIYRT